MDLLHPFYVREKSPPKDKDDHRQYGSEEKEPKQRPVSRAFFEESTWPQCSPNHACVEMCARKRASEAIHCVLCADARNVVERPVEHGDLA